jgi:lipopolysaccharide transport system ATP-binding protein
MLLSGTPKVVVEGYHRLLYAPPAMHDSIREQVRRLAAESRDLPAPQHTIAHGAVGGPTLGGDAADPTETAALAPPRAISASDASRAYFNPDMKPQTTIVYDCQGAEILDLHVTTLAGEKVNTLVPSEEYVYRYRVRFTRPAYHVRFANGIKSRLDSLISSMSIPYGGIPLVSAGSEINVAFRFRSLMTPDVYFLNAGVVGMVDGREAYLHRIVDALMIRVSDHAGRVVIGNVNLYTDAQYSERPGSADQVAA